MSADVFWIKGGGINGWEPTPDSITRHETVTEGLDTVCDLLASARRRYLLYYLFSVNGTVAELEAAVNAVQTYEAAGTDTDDPPSRETIKIDLQHHHLPRLADTGNCEYDRRQGTIRFTPHPALEELVEHAHHKELN